MSYPLIRYGVDLFSIAYSIGEGPVPFVYSAESMPLYVREIGQCHIHHLLLRALTARGMSFVTAVNWFFNFLLAFTFPQFRAVSTDPGAFGYYAAWCAIGWVFILL